MKLSICFLMCGLCALVIGIGTCFGDHNLAKIDDSVLAKVMVSGACEKCVTPEPDCPSKHCFSTGWNCQEWDDYLFAEDNSCTSNDGTVCARSDYGPCYKVTEYAYPNVGGCTFNGCQSGGSTFTSYAYDDCATDTM